MEEISPPSLFIEILYVAKPAEGLVWSEVKAEV